MSAKKKRSKYTAQDEALLLHKQCGKGSWHRPRDLQKWYENYDKIFRKEEVEEDEDEDT